MTVENTYLIRDNGLRCFAPPCFFWDIVDVDKQTIMTVSDVDITQLGLSAEQANRVMELLTRGQLKVKGYTIEYEVQAVEELPARKGIRFVVIQIIEQTNL